jgi:hypothetical protein
MTDTAERPDGGYQSNIGLLIRHYPDYTIMGAFEGFGWRARFRAATGQGRGKPSPAGDGFSVSGRSSVGRELLGMTLDALADEMDADRKERAKAKNHV